MKQRIGKALDHLIYLHKIEDRKVSGADHVRVAGATVFVLGWMFVAGALLHGEENAVMASATVGSYTLPICSVEVTEPKLALTFDVAWSDDNLDEILGILKAQEVQAAFFVTGEWVEAYPEKVQAILNAGHDLGNHSENHLSMSMLSDTEKKEEILTVHKRVKELTGYEMEFFRPPHGDYENGVITAAEKCGYYTILWNVNSLDWKDYGAERIVETVTQNPELGPGSIILFHSSGMYTAEALEQMLEVLRGKGYGFVSVSELIYRDNCYVDVDGKQKITGVTDYEY